MSGCTSGPSGGGGVNANNASDTTDDATQEEGERCLRGMMKRSYPAGNASTMINGSRPKLRRMINHIDDDTDSTKGQGQRASENPLATTTPPSSSTSTTQMMMIPTPQLPSAIPSTTTSIVTAGCEDDGNTEADHTDNDQEDDVSDHSGDCNGDGNDDNGVSLQILTNTCTFVMIEGQIVCHWHVQNSWTDRFIPWGRSRASF